jgi:hypothetical protein
MVLRNQHGTFDVLLKMPSEEPVIAAFSEDGKVIVVPIQIKQLGPVPNLPAEAVKQVGQLCAEAADQASRLLSEPTITLEEAATKVGKSLHSVRQMATMARVPVLSRGGLRWVSELDVRSYFETAKVGNPGTPRKKS